MAMTFADQEYSVFFLLDSDQFDIFKDPPLDSFSYSQFEHIVGNDKSYESYQLNGDPTAKDNEPHQKCEVYQDMESGEAAEEFQGKRVDNTIFKTSLSEYRKSIIDYLKARPSLKWIFEEIKRIYRSKNMSIFPKLNFMVRQLNISQQITTRWILRSQSLIAKKRVLVSTGKYSSMRLNELEKSIDTMSFCMSEPLFEVGFQKYWGKYKQSNKFNKSKTEVLDYLNQFKTLLIKNSSHAKAHSEAIQDLPRKCSESSNESSQASK